MKKVIAILMAFCLALVGAYAINDAVGSTAVVVTEAAELTESSADNDVAEGGNVTEMDLETNLSTNRWQGYVGNVTASLQLGTDNGILHDFGAASVDTVFATTESSTYSWSALEAAAAADLDGVGLWNFAAGADQATDVFTSTQTFDGIASVPSVQLNSNFDCGIMDDGASGTKDNIMFAANIDNGGSAGYDGGIYQYEMMVPTDTQSVETYYFYMSLDE